MSGGAQGSSGPVEVGGGTLAVGLDSGLERCLEGSAGLRLVFGL